MKKELLRIFIGNSSWQLLFELVFRTTVMYFYALALLRLLGKRGLGALAPFELAVIIALGAAIGDPMLMRDVPLIHGMVVISVVVSLQRLFVHATQRHRTIEFLAQSTAKCLVKDGMISLRILQKEGFSREDLFLSLREKEIEHLGQVKRAFLETTGHVSVWRFEPEQVKPGISILPQDDEDAAKPIDAGQRVRNASYYSCCRCGYSERVHENQKHLIPCPLCGGRTWVPSSTIGVFDVKRAV